MAELSLWLAIAGVGALHALSPANGWLLAAACGLHARDEAQARRAVGPIAWGQVASMTLLAWAFSQGVSIDRTLMRDVAIALPIGGALWLCVRRARHPIRVSAPARHAGIALWSFLVASAQGAGLMLVPALVPLCSGAGPASELAARGSVLAALAAVAVHTAAMLLTTGLLASGVCRAFAALLTRSLHRPASRPIEAHSARAPSPASPWRENRRDRSCRPAEAEQMHQRPLSTACPQQDGPPSPHDLCSRMRPTNVALVLM